CSDGIVVLDEQWRCVVMSDRAAELLDTDAEGAVDKTIWDVFGPVLDDSTCERWRRACLDHLPAELGEFGTPEGRYVACRCWPVGGDAALLSIIDVTNCIEPLKDAADERQRIESFLAVLAHELRSPLSTLSQGLLVLRNAKGGVDRELLLDRMERQLRYLVRIVEDLVDVSQIVRGRINVRRERVRVDEVIAEASTAVDAVAAAKGIQVHSEAPIKAAVQ